MYLCMPSNDIQHISRHNGQQITHFGKKTFICAFFRIDVQTILNEKYNGFY